MNKLSEIENLILCHHPHVLVITETWLHAGVLDCEVIPASYKLLRNDRTSRGGGVAIAIKNNIKFSVLEGIPEHESLWCKLSYSGKTILLAGVYRPPNATPQYLEAVHDYLSQHTNSRSNIIITGDFNLPGIN